MTGDVRGMSGDIGKAASGERDLPFDRDEKLGAPPWHGPKLAAWEAAHGHDARLKCYPEFGCQLLPTPEDFEVLRDAAQALCDALDAYRQSDWVRQRVFDAEAALRSVLDHWGER